MTCDGRVVFVGVLKVAGLSALGVATEFGPARAVTVTMEGSTWNSILLAERRHQSIDVCEEWGLVFYVMCSMANEKSKTRNSKKVKNLGPSNHHPHYFVVMGQRDQEKL